jgi:prepilin-type N-terminal cleavage/methylation domain-containing protein
MKRNKFQPGFTLIELIAVMVILAILAAVVIPRITSVQEGAYESNVGNMFGAIRNYVSNEALRNAVTTGRGMEVYTEPNETGANYYLDLWIKDYDADKWVQTHGGANGGRNPNKVAGTEPASIIFEYHPHGAGIASRVLKDIYYIEYFPATTKSAKDDNYDYDTFSLIAYKDDDDGSGHDCNDTFEPTDNDVAIENMYLGAPTAGDDTRLSFVNPQP